MTTLRKAAQQALEALEVVTRHFTRTPSTLKDSETRGETHKAITALRAALVEPVQEPVAVVRWDDIGHISWRALVMLPDGTPLYTAQPQRKPLRSVTYVCPVCAASLERQE